MQPSKAFLKVCRRLFNLSQSVSYAIITLTTTVDRESAQAAIEMVQGPRSSS